jgi:hypothetical protein
MAGLEALEELPRVLETHRISVGYSYPSRFGLQSHFTVLRSILKSTKNLSRNARSHPHPRVVSLPLIWPALISCTLPNCSNPRYDHNGRVSLCDIP